MRVEGGPLSVSVTCKEILKRVKNNAWTLGSVSLVDWLLDFPAFVPSDLDPVVSPRQPRRWEGIFKITFLGIRRQKWHQQSFLCRGGGAVVEKTDLNLASQDGCPPQSLPTCGGNKTEGRKRKLQ